MYFKIIIIIITIITTIIHCEWISLMGSECIYEATYSKYLKGTGVAQSV
jgi:hypothetical protein